MMKKSLLKNIVSIVLSRRITFLLYLFTTVIIQQTLVSTAKAESPKAPDCSTESTALDQYLCYREILAHIEEGMEKDFKKAISDVQSDLGKDAVQEIQARMQSAQKAWYQYRDDQCLQNYYTKASIRPPSQDLAATLCKIAKTQSRMKEIRSSKISN